MICRLRAFVNRASIVTLALACTVVLCAAATLDQGPYLQDLREDRVTVLWATTDGAGVGEVRYRNASSPTAPWSIARSQARRLPPEVTLLPAAIYQHEAQLGPLAAGTSYTYRVYLDGADALPSAAATDLVFRTPDSGPFSFLALGDSGDGGSGQRAVARRMASQAAGMVLHLGDAAYDTGTFADYKNYFFNIYSPWLASTPFYVAPGNHEYYFLGGEAFRDLFSPPVNGVPPQGRGLVYSFDRGEVHFIVLDSNLPLEQAGSGDNWMLRWAEQDLAATRKLWRVAVFHHTPFPTSTHVGDRNCVLAQDLLTPILERQGVHLVLSGHEHVYQRSFPRRAGVFSPSGPGTVYVTSGGGGSSVYPPGPSPYIAASSGVSHFLRADVDGGRMQVTAIDPDGVAQDTFVLSAAPQVDGEARDAALFAPGIAPGGLVSILGWNLAPGEGIAYDYPLPTKIGGVQITANGEPLPLLYVSRMQLNAQLPFSAPGALKLRVETPGGSFEWPQAVLPAAPVIFSVTTPGGRVPAITKLDGSVVTLQNPARSGDWITIWATGLGPVAGKPVAGRAAVAAETLTAVRVLIGPLDATVSYAGLAPGWAGLYQVNVQVPGGLNGPQSLQLSVGPTSSPSVSLAMR